MIVLVGDTCTAEQHMLAGFVEEMRFVAMKLHTKDQAPKEGGQKAAEQPFQKVSRRNSHPDMGPYCDCCTSMLLVYAHRAAVSHVTICPV